MTGTIEDHCLQLSKAVETMMNDSTDQQQRKATYQLCEDFKENSPLCVQCGLYLATHSTLPMLTNFGLQLIEHSIKYRWNAMNSQEKLFIKNNSLNLIRTGTTYILSEKFIKNAFAKVIVEMIKREWPQHWPNLWQELRELCDVGEIQTEIVLLTLLRLIEDTVTLQTIQAKRRREIHHALTSNMKEIFGFIIELFYHHLSKFNELREQQQAEQQQQALAHCRVAKAVLETLTAFVDWIPVNFIMSDNGSFLQTLCITLSNQDLQRAAAECLLQIVNRKGKLEDREPLLVLFNTEPMEGIFKAAIVSSSLPLEDDHYLFLTRLCQVLIGIGYQLCALWGSTYVDISQPQNFNMYLDAILEFTKHPSQMLSSCTLPLWISFLRHELISKDQVLRSFLPRIAEIAKYKLIKIGYPSHNDSVSCNYSRMDFESDEEFIQFFPKYRALIAEVLRLVTVLEPVITYEYAAKWLEDQLKKPVNLGEDIKHCSMNSPAVLEWDALSIYLESVFSRILQTSKSKPSAEDGIRLLKAVLNYDTQDPVVLSSTLSCISALFVFLLLDPDTLPAVLDKIFATLVFSLPGQTKATRSRAVKNVRRHACSSLVKICKQYPTLLLPSFDQIYMHVNQLSTDPEQLSQMEKCTLLEALILISNHFNDFDKQSLFIKEILSPITSVWLTHETRQAFLSVEGFMSYIGLDQAPVEPSNDDVVGINRSQIIFCVNMILAVIKRSKWPEDLDDAKKGGFIKSIFGSDNGSLLCNPATNHILPLLENILLLLRCFNQLWQPGVMEKISPEYTRACDMPETDKKNILGINPPCVDICDPIVKQPLERMQHFLTNVHDNCYHILGNAGQSLGTEFYKLPGLADCIISCILLNIDSIPDYRVRPIIRVFMKPFVQCCPPEYYQSALTPVLIQLCPYMFQRLNNKWLQMNQRSEENNINDEENSDTQEVLDVHLNRQLTREYIDLLAALLQVKKTPTFDSVGEVPMEEEDRHSSFILSYPLSDLGKLVLKHEILGPSITRCYFRALSWDDSTTCNKCLHLCGPILKQLVNTQMIGSQDARDLMICVLTGLQQHGQHDMTRSCLLNLGLQTYELLRPQNDSILEVMFEIPESCLNDLKAFDEKLTQSNPSKQISEKKKKEMFKNIVEPIIGKNVGQLFKNEVHIKNLPPLFQHSTPKPPSILEDSTDNRLLCRLLCRLFGEED